MTKNWRGSEAATPQERKARKLAARQVHKTNAAWRDGLCASRRCGEAVPGGRQASKTEVFQHVQWWGKIRASQRSVKAGQEIFIWRRQ